MTGHSFTTCLCFFGNLFLQLQYFFERQFSTSGNFFRRVSFFKKGNGIFNGPEGFPASTEFTWTNVTSLNNKAQALSGTEIKTTEDLSGLGTVSGNVELTITDSQIHGSVFGGGESSDVTGVDKTVTVTLNGSTTIDHNVFGGGNEGAVNGSTNVIIN